MLHDSSKALTTATVSEDIGLIIDTALRSLEFSNAMLKPSEKSNVISTIDTSFTSTFITNIYT